MPFELILAFHGLGDPPEHIVQDEREFWVPLSWFETLLDEARACDVGIAFDDGNVSDVEQALPALRERNMTARFFPLSGRIGREDYLDVEDIVELRAAGMTIGSQGIAHRDWRTLDDAGLRDELVLSRQRLGEILGEEITEAACPFGSYDRRVLHALRDAGYRRVFNSDGSTGASSATISPRETVAQNQSLEYWVARVRTESRRRPGPVRIAKRFLKRMR